MVCKTSLPIAFYHSLASLKVQSQSNKDDKVFSLDTGKVEWIARTGIDLTVIVNDATSHAVGPAPREHPGRRLLWIKVLGISLWTRSIGPKHLFKLVNFKDVSADHPGGVDQSVPVRPARLTTWMYRTPEIIEWLTLKVIRTLNHTGGQWGSR